MSEEQLRLTELEMLEPGYRAIQKLKLETVEQLLRTPVREFMRAAGCYEPIRELVELLANLGISTSGTPFGEYVPEAERPAPLSGPVRVFQNGEPVFSVEL